MVDIYQELETIKKEALNNNVPIMEDDSIDFITDYIVKNNKYRILEIGTAVGYSAIMMALSHPDVMVTSIERDKNRYLKAINNIKTMHLENRITLIFNDALKTDIDGKYDLIIIDAAKSQNISFFEKYEKNLEINGTVITDNLSFHGMTSKKLEEIESKNVRGLVKKINEYKEFLKKSDKYKTKFYNIGDGISVTERRN